MKSRDLIVNTRLKLGISQKSLADKLGVSQSFICDIEAGRKNLPARWVPHVRKALAWDAWVVDKFKAMLAYERTFK